MLNINNKKRAATPLRTLPLRGGARVCNLFIILLLFLTTTAQADNTLSVPDVTAGWGTTIALSVNMENSDANVAAVQFTLELPDGATLRPDRIEKSERIAAHTVSVRRTERGKYTFIILSSEGQAIRGYSGTLLTVDMQIGSPMSEGHSYPMTITNAVMSLNTGENVLQETTAGTITVARSTDFTVSNVTVSQTETVPGETIDVSWTVSNIGEVAATGGWHEQVLLVSFDGEEEKLLGTVYNDESALLAPGASVSRTARVKLPQLLGIDGDARVRVRLVPDSGSGERTEAQGNNTATSGTLLNVSKQLLLQLPTGSILENSSPYIEGTLLRTGSWRNDETFMLSITGDDRLPSQLQVTIPARQSSVRFQLPVANNDVVDESSAFLLSVEGNGYAAVTEQIVIEDDELPALTVTASKLTVSEGDTFQLTISRSYHLQEALTVMLTCEHPARFTYPQQVTIPAGQQSVTVEVTAKDDDLPGETLSTAFVASTPRYEKGEAIVLLEDDDMPVLQLSLVPCKVQESAGPVSVAGILRRTGITTNKITVRLSDDSHGGLYFGTRELVLTKGVEEVSFNFGPVDNAQVDGDRTYTVTAAVWLSSCSCSAAGESAGSVSATLEVLDDDGPALTLTSSLSTIKEGGKAMLTVGRNTLASLDQPLIVHLSSDYDDNLSYNHTVTIPAGQQTAQVEVASTKNDVGNDTNTAVFTAQAEGFASATCYMMITDQTLADATITNISVAETEVKATEESHLSMTIVNHGQALLPAGAKVKLYAHGNDNAIGIYATAEAIEQGASTTITVAATMPSVPGHYYLYAVVNELRTIPELNYGNNTSTYVAIQVLPRLSTTVSTDKTVYKQGEQITVSGTVMGITEGTEVEVYTMCDGIRKSFATTSDAQGYFSSIIQPSEGMVGHTLIGACFPGEQVTAGQTAVEIIGLKTATNEYITCQTWVGEAYSGTFPLQNPDSIAQTFSSIEVVQKPPHCAVNLQHPSTIKAGETANVEYTLLGEAPTEGSDWEKIIIRATTYEGASVEQTLYYYCRPAQGCLVASENQINTTVTAGTTRLYPIIVTNQGKGATGKISLFLPNVEWLSTSTPSVMPSLEYGDSATIVLRFTATTDMALNVPFTGTIGVNCENGNGLPISFSMEPVSDLTGMLTVSVTDEYTYYLENAPGVADATVTVRHPTSGIIVAQGDTDNNGHCNMELAEGYYRIDVEAQKHNSYTNYIQINPGRELRHEAFISYQAITYSMTVEETEVEDQYEIITKVDYETNVPKPVIIISLPEEEPIPGVPFPVVVTNKGLIALQQVNIQAVISPEYSFELIGNTMLDVLGPQQSHILYAVIHDTTTPDTPGITPGGNGGSGDMNVDLPGIGDDNYDSWIMSRWRNKCIIAYLVVEGFYVCGPDWKWHFIPVFEHAYLFDCIKDKPDDGGTWIQPPNIGWNPPGGGVVGSGVVPQAVPVTTYECNPCLGKADERILDCILGIGGSLIPFVGGLGSVVADCTSIETDPATGRTRYSYSSDNYCARGILTAAISFASGKLGFALGVGLCLYDLWGTIKCLRSKPKSQARGFIQDKSDDVEWLYNCHEVMVNEVQAAHDFFVEYFGNEQWIDCNVEELDALIAYITANPEHFTFTVDELMYLKPIGISDDVFALFVERVNNTNLYDHGLAEPASNMANAETIAACWNTMKSCEERAVAMGYATTADLYVAAIPPTQQLLTASTSHVCTHVSFEIKQAMTLNRPAFRARLEVFNGHEETAMQNVKLNLLLKADDGTVASAREFQVNAEYLNGFEGELNIDSGWTLNAQRTGIATILLIPTKYAAPTEAKSYTLSGTLSYLDPFTEVEVARPLLPQQLTVTPLPDLELTYLMQRDVYGDDPLTKNVVEPMEEAEFALIINNKGNGEAKNLRMLTEQPKIVENEKGLFIDFDIVSSQVNGEPAVLSLGQTIANDFGNIGAHSQSYAQWWLRSSLLGHFTSYEVEANHVTSYGNQDLSLIDTVTIHEMIHGFSVAAVKHGLTPRGYLVNDIVDADDLPDIVYFTDATQQPLSIATGTIERRNNSEFLLIVTPRQEGWNYGSVPDPTGGRQKLIGITRSSDGMIIPLDNVWQTDRTLRDGRDWFYENRLHFVGEMGEEGETFVLIFEPKPDVELAVEHFLGVPDEHSFLTEPLKELTVVFNKAVQNETFTIDDLTLFCQGNRQDASDIIITPMNTTTYHLGLEQATHQDGYYVLTVQTAGITDTEGFRGSVGKTASWTQVLGQGQGIETPTTDADMHVRISARGDWLTVTGDFRELRSVDVYDLRGMKRIQTMRVQAGQAVYIGLLPRGVYDVQVATDRGTMHVKMLKR